MSTVNTWHLIGATILGVIGAASMLIVEHFRQERRRHVLSQDLDRMNTQLSSMRIELEQLRETQSARSDRKSKKNKRRNHSVVSTTTTSTEDYSSAVDIDSSDQEFYDLSEDEVVDKPLDSVLSDIDKSFDSGKIELIKEALVILQNLNTENPKKIDVLWRIAKAYYHIAMAATDVNIKQKDINKGIEHSVKALAINQHASEVHKWYAILIGLRSDFQSMKDRIADGHLFKKHIDKAISLNPSDPSLHHLLGRFAYEIAGLKWYERTAATALFGEPPNATYDEALDHFVKAEDLSQKEWKENKMLIGKCHVAKGDYQNGVQWLTKAKNITSKDEIEEQLDVEIKTLLTKYNTYIS